jgi:hypothetical protein
MKNHRKWGVQTVPDDTELIAYIDAIIAKLSLPLPPQEKRNGWTDKARINYLTFFNNLKEMIAADSGHPWPTGIARSMDFWGVIAGELLEDAAKIGNMARELERTKVY